MYLLYISSLSRVFHHTIRMLPVYVNFNMLHGFNGIPMRDSANVDKLFTLPVTLIHLLLHQIDIYIHTKLETQTLILTICRRNVIIYLIIQIYDIHYDAIPNTLS